MTDGSESKSSSVLNKIITIIIAVGFLSSVLGFLLLEHAPFIYSTITGIISLVSLLALPFTLGIYWYSSQISQNSRNLIRLIPALIFMTFTVQWAFKYEHGQTTFTTMIITQAMLMILIYLPFYLGRGISAARSALHRN